MQHKSPITLWEQIFKSKEWGKYPGEPFIRFIAHNFYHLQRSNIYIFELGLGTGANLWYLAREGFKVGGIEYSKVGIERFKNRLKDDNLLNSLQDIYEGDYEEQLTRLKDDSLDCIFESASFMCNDIIKTKRVIKIAYKKLKLGGKFFSTGPVRTTGQIDFSANAMQELTSGPYANTGKVRFATQNDLESLYEIDSFNTLPATNNYIKINNYYELTQNYPTTEGEQLLNKIFVLEGEKIGK